MAEQAGLGFGGLLRRLRDDAGLTQEELAEAARVSQRAVSDLERGINRTARKDTALLLAGALGLDGQARELFIVAARGHGRAAEVLAARQPDAPGAFAAAATRTLPCDIASFTGRRAELAQLMRALAAGVPGPGVVGIHAIDGMAGVGKTTFAVHAVHQLAENFPDGQFLLPLHAHTAGQRPVEPADALASLLLTAGVAARQIPPGLEARAARWRDHVAGRKILLLLDDAAGHDQVRPLLPGTAGSLVLVTSRRRLAALADAGMTNLDILPAEDAAALLAHLAARPGMSAGDPAVGEVTRLCGFLPLAIAMVAGQLRHHPARTAADLAAELAAARDRLDLMRAENLSVAAAFDLSYADLTQDQRQLFRRLGLVPGPTVDAHATAALHGTSLDVARRLLDGLYDQHLLTEPTPGQYVLHDLLRAHARALAAADEPGQSDPAAGWLLDYYLHTAEAAGRHFASRVSAYHRPAPSRPPDEIPDLSSPGKAGAWLEAQHANLHAGADYAAVSGRPLQAVRIATAMSGFLAARGLWNQSVALHDTALAAARQAEDRSGQAIALAELADMQLETGDYPAATASLNQALALYGDTGDLSGQSYALNQLGFVHAMTGDYPAAIASHQQALELARNASDRLAEANTLGSRVLVQQLTGDFTAAAASGRQALKLFRQLGHLQGQAYALNNLGFVQQEIRHYRAAAASQQQALDLFRNLGDLLGQAYALNDLGLVQRESADYLAAGDSHQQALALFREFGNRPGQAEALNRLGALAFRTSATHQAREYHSQALAIARDIGVPLEEARALEGIGQSYSQDDNATQATAYLLQALAIYQRIGAPAARRVQETLHHQRLTSVLPQLHSTAHNSEGHQAEHLQPPPETSDRTRSAD